MISVLRGDCRDLLPTLADASVQCVVTSPPYFGLRDYGVAGQIGLEPSPDEYVAELVAVFREVRRVLRDDGTLWLNLGDSYTSSVTTNGGYSAKSTLAGFTNPTTKGRIAKPKDLLMIPAQVALALRADGWWLRSDIIWAKPNPMPESVTDRPTSAHEHVFLLTKSARYFFDADAVREEHLTHGGGGLCNKQTLKAVIAGASHAPSLVNATINPNGRNLRNVWTIATTPYSEAHFATFPPALAERCIKAGTSERGCCAACGTPWKRITERIDTGRTQKMADGWDTGPGGHGTVHRDGRERGQTGVAVMATATTGWAPSCQCDAAVVPCTVLDPFCGAGTALMVADRLQRHAIGIELNPAYATLTTRRIEQDAGLFAEITA